MVVGMPKVHVFNSKVYLVNPLMQTMQKPLIGLVQMIV